MKIQDACSRSLSDASLKEAFYPLSQMPEQCRFVSDAHWMNVSIARQADNGMAALPMLAMALNDTPEDQILWHSMGVSDDAPKNETPRRFFGSKPAAHPVRSGIEAPETIIVDTARALSAGDYMIGFHRKYECTAVMVAEPIEMAEPLLPKFILLLTAPI